MNELINFLPTLEEVASCAQAALSELCNKLSWLLQTIISQIDNREIATFLLLLAIVLFALVKGNPKKILEGIRGVITAALTPKIIVPTILLVAYSSAIFIIASHIGLWTSSILFNTLLEVAFVGFSSLFIAVKAHSITSIFRQFVLPEIGIGAIIAIYIGIESFSLPVEIILQFFILILTCFQAIGKHRPDGQSVVKLSSCLLGVIGIVVFIAATIKLTNEWSSIEWINELENIAMGVYYPILMMPFAISLGYYAAFEMLGMRIKMNSKKIGFISRAHLYLLLFPSLIDIKHFGYYEATKYAECLSWKDQTNFIKDYKKRIKEAAAKENRKIARMKSGQGKAGFDEEGIWQDWENFEKIKTNLWTIASVQNRNWQENRAYSANMQSEVVNVFTPCGCTSGSYVSDDLETYVCWMSNGTGFTFGMGSSNGNFPPMKYEGMMPPSINQNEILSDFVDCDDEARLPHWFMDFYTNDSYQ